MAEMRIRLRKPKKVRCKRDDIAATNTDCEVSPAPCAYVDAEAAEVTIVAPRVARHPLVTYISSIRQPPGYDLWQER